MSRFRIVRMIRTICTITIGQKSENFPFDILKGQNHTFDGKGVPGIVFYYICAKKKLLSRRKNKIFCID